MIAAVLRKGPEAGFHCIRFDFHGLSANTFVSCLFIQSQNQRKHTQNEFQTMSQSLKTGNRHIFPPFKRDIRPAIRMRGDKKMMHHEMPPGMQQQEMLMMEMWETLTDDQKKTLLKRMLDSKIMMKEGMIKHFQFKIETMEMIKTMLDEC